MKWLKSLVGAADQAAEVVRLKDKETALLKELGDNHVEIADLKRESEKNASDAQAWRIKYEQSQEKLDKAYCVISKVIDATKDYQTWTITR